MPDHEPLTDEELDKMAEGYAPVPLSECLERANADIRKLRAVNVKLRAQVESHERYNGSLHEGNMKLEADNAKMAKRLEMWRKLGPMMEAEIRKLRAVEDVLTETNSELRRDAEKFGELLEGQFECVEREQADNAKLRHALQNLVNQITMEDGEIRLATAREALGEKEPECPTKP